MSAHGGDRDDDNISEANDAFEGDERHEDKDEGELLKFTLYILLYSRSVISGAALSYLTKLC